ncbi:Threonine--tRNA ligase [bioreactor metagenome]|uniref:Threonine--tRNA ligase n=1 Tax=bioreactor metagenome TaxID=1076179 RepID=A0A645IHB9_9ZZZZ
MRINNGEKPFFPLWLSPIQVRILPVADQHAEKAISIADQIPFRVDVDDRNLKIGKKIRDAEKEWIPYTIVVGDKEIDGETLPVRPRSGEQEDLTLNELIVRIQKETGGMPMTNINTPKLLSKRPVFVG